MNLKSLQRAPLLFAISLILLVCGIRWWCPTALESLEANTYDWRVRLALNYPGTVASNLGFVAITDESIQHLRDGSLLDGDLPLRYGLYWPRHIHGRVLRELSAQGVKAVAFDVLFAETRPDHSPILVETNTEPGLVDFIKKLHPEEPGLFLDTSLNVESDDFFAWELYRQPHGYIAADKRLLPHPLFRDYAGALGDIAADKDSDGVLRRARAFNDLRLWHPLIERAAVEYHLDLTSPRIEQRQIIFTARDHQEVTVPLAADGTFDPVDFFGAAADHMPRARPFTEKRVWHMGILLAAQELGLRLDQAEVELSRGRITLSNGSDVQRVIPVDAEGYFYVNWELPLTDARLAIAPIELLLAQDIARRHGSTNELPDFWQGKLVVVGSLATGNDLTDLGTTPLAKETYLVSKHWNVASSVITGHFIQRTSLTVDWLLIAALGALTALFTLRMRSLPGLFAVLGLGLVYTAFAVLVYLQNRYWLPIFLPVFVTLSLQYAGLVTWRAVFEQAEKRRVRSVFSKIVAPEVVHELLASDNVALGGARREVTVFFADVRGFTAFADVSREDAMQVARQKKLTGTAVDEHFDREARETLKTVNTYLALVADIVKKHGGTLDKYIGDCVMAFWNAPTAHQQHAVACVRAAIEAQRAVAELNRCREQENDRRSLENIQRSASSQPLLPLSPILTLGMGLNTGQAIVGLMGSDAHILNYTVFGREVNLASRLESLSGHGRILIGETTHSALLRDDPALAASCQPLSPAMVKGFRDAVKFYEVPWQQTEILLTEPAKPR